MFASPFSLSRVRSQIIRAEKIVHSHLFRVRKGGCLRARPIMFASRYTYHHIDADKYRQRYLAEAQYRVNRRFDLHSLVGRMVHACVRTEPCTERWLRLAQVASS